MKILFVGLNSYYTEGLNYQDNSFCKVFLDEGHDVTYISNPEAYVDGVKTYVGASESIVENGVKLIRVDYKFDKYISKKLKIYKSIYKYLDDIKPDIIYCHGTQYCNIFEIVKYKLNNKNVKVYADTHTAYKNAKISNWYSFFLYNLYYKKLYKTIEPYLEKYFYVGIDEKQFSIDVYKAREELMEFLPLGGFTINDKNYKESRVEIRQKLELKDDDILVVHSGKLDALKNTIWLINTINNISIEKLKLVIIGNIPDSNKELLRTINNNRNENIIYLGWQSSKELLKYICAADIYAQPGTASVTFNNAICCQTPIISYKHEFYNSFYNIKSICWIKSEDDIEKILIEICTDSKKLIYFKEEAKKSKNLLDYVTLLHKAIEF